MNSRLSVTLLSAVCLACLLLVVGTTVCESAESGEAVQTTDTGAEQIPEVNEAIELFKKGDLKGAKEKLDVAYEKNADLPPAQVVMAEFFAQSKQGGGVRGALENAVVEAPEDPEAYVLLGDLALAGGRVTEADLLFQKGSALLKKFDRSQKRKDVLAKRVVAGLAATAEARQQWAVAQGYLQQWLKLDAANTTAMQRLARALFRQGKASEALDQLKAAEAADPKNMLSSAATLARFYQQAGDTENARQWIDYALKKSPSDIRIRLVAAQMKLEMGDLDQAEKEAEAAAQLEPTSLPAKVLRGVIALFKQDYRTAATHFESAHLQAPDNFEAKNNLALALAEQDDKAKKQRALAFAQENARLFSQRPEAISTYGWALYQAGRIAEADKVMQQLLRSGNFTADTAYYIAQIAHDQGRQDQSKALLQAALGRAKFFSRKADAEALLAKLQ